MDVLDYIHLHLDRFSTIFLFITLHLQTHGRRHTDKCWCDINELRPYVLKVLLVFFFFFFRVSAVRFYITHHTHFLFNVTHTDFVNSSPDVSQKSF